MPYISEKIKLPPKYDRRRRLSDEQRQEITQKYSTGEYSLRQLGREYNVDKGTIRNLVNPEALRYYREYVKTHWRNHQESGDKWNATIREHRAYKHQLYKQGKIK